MKSVFKKHQNEGSWRINSIVDVYTVSQLALGKKPFLWSFWNSQKKFLDEVYIK